MPRAAKGADCGSNPKKVMRAASSSGVQPGSSETERVRSARVALEKTARELKGRSPNTSVPNTRSRASAAVIPLKS